MSYRGECVNVPTITVIHEFPSEVGDNGPFVSNKILWLKYKLCTLKSCTSAICF